MSDDSCAMCKGTGKNIFNEICIYCNGTGESNSAAAESKPIEISSPGT